MLELAYRHPEAVSTIVCVDGGFIDLGTRFPDWDDAATALAPPRLAGTPLDQITGWLENSAADWPEEGRQGTLANFEVRDDGTIAPWLTFDRHMMVLRGLWEHQPSSRYPFVEVPTLLIAADTGDVAWTHSKHEAVDAAVAALPRGRAVWFSPAHHDVHAQQPTQVGDLLHRAVTEPDFFPSPEARTVTTPRILAIMGSGETAPTMKGPHRSIFERLGPDVDAVLLDTPFGFQENAPILAAKATEYFRDAVGREVVAGRSRPHRHR